MFKTLFSLFPSYCVHCKKCTGGDPFCKSCLQALLRLKPPWCLCCGNPYLEELKACGWCLKESFRESGIQKVRSLWVYQEEAASLVAAIKFNRAFGVLNWVAREVASVIRQEFSHIDSLVPVPLSRKEFQKRLFNQTVLLARAVAKEIAVPVLPLLEKVRETLPQRSLTQEDRLKNLRKAFRMTNKAEKRPLPNRILLIDDVMTTGATLTECSKVLRREGVQEIYAFTLTRTFMGN